MENIIDTNFTIDEFEHYKIVTFIESELTMENLRGSIPFLIQTLMNDSDCNVLINMTNVMFIDSSFLGHMINLNKKLKVRNNMLIFFNIQNTVMELLIVSRLHKFFKIAKNRNDAVAELKLP